MAPILPLILFFGTCSLAYIHGMQLDKVFILSRHNIRAPLGTNLQPFSMRTWPAWEVGPEELTKKGAILERYLGDYFYEWMTSHNISCKDIYMYANVKERTIDSGKHFAKGFPNCVIPVHHHPNLNLLMDPFINPIIHNTSKIFEEEIKAEMRARLEKANLYESYKELYRIIDFKNSAYCQNNCSLALKGESIPMASAGKEPDFEGALHITNFMIDAFIMMYYDGFENENIAWGEIKSEAQWDLLVKIFLANQNIRFQSKVAAPDITKPVIGYMKSMLNEKKVTILYCHDSNMNHMITALKFAPYNLPGQREPVPIGGKLMFEKWNNGTEDFLKVEFVYQTWDELRNATTFSMRFPPNNVTMYLEGMVDNGGFYLWSDFMKRLDDLTR